MGIVVVVAVLVRSLVILGHRLGLHHSALIALTFQNSLLALILLDLGDLRLVLV